MEPNDKDPALRVPFPPLLHLLGLGAGILLHLLWMRLRIFPESWIGHATGWPVVAVGVLLFGWAVWSMIRSGENPDPDKPTRAILSAGPFAFTRNPIYVAITVFYVGVALVMNTIWMIILLPVALLYVHYVVIIREERYLEQLFREEYLEYKARVRRWI